MFISSALAQAPGGGAGDAGLLGFLPIVLMFVLLYFLMIRPQMKRQKEHMLKEIFEQPWAIRETVLGRVSVETGRVFLEEMGLSSEASRPSSEWSSSPAARPRTPGS